MSAATVTRYLGCCQICEAEQKLTADRKMVHHGYQRPGHGSIVGDCYGVGELPYELSRDLLPTYQVGLENALRGKREYQARLESGAVLELTVEKFRSSNRRHEMTTITMADDPIAFRYALDSKKSEVRYAIQALEREVSRVQKRHDEWPGVRPVRTIEERAAEEKAAKEARAAERAAARATRDAKKAATKAKQDALAARRAFIVKDLRERFEALANVEFGVMSVAERQRQARKLAEKLKAKKYAWLWWHELGCDDALVALGLAERMQGTTRVRYTF